MKRTIELEAWLGEHIEDYAARVYEAGKKTNIIFKFNGIVFAIENNASPAEIVSFYKEESEKSRLAYEKSPEYKQQLLEREESLKQANKAIQFLTDRLEIIDWDSLDAVINWLCEIQPVADNSGVIIDVSKIITTFSKNGFYANVNVGKDFIEDDRENVARYIIGQALDGFEQVGSPHPMLLTFAERWKAKIYIDDADVVI